MADEDDEGNGGGLWGGEGGMEGYPGSGGGVELY